MANNVWLPVEVAHKNFWSRKITARCKFCNLITNEVLWPPVPYLNLRNTYRRVFSMKKTKIVCTIGPKTESVDEDPGPTKDRDFLLQYILLIASHITFFFPRGIIYTYWLWHWFWNLISIRCRTLNREIMKAKRYTIATLMALIFALASIQAQPARRPVVQQKEERERNK